MKLEAIILNNFFNILNSMNANYCIMNNYKDMPDFIPSDVDIAIDMKTYSTLDSIIINLAESYNVVITQKIWHGYNKCAYILSPLEINSCFWLQLDFFVDFSGKGFPRLLSNNAMLSKKQNYKNFYAPKPEIEVPFLLQRRIFKGDIEKKHVLTLHELYYKNTESVQNGIVQIFGKKEGQSLIEFIESKNIKNFKKNYSNYRKRLKKISSDNTGFMYRIKYTTWQFIRAIYRFYYPTGLSVAFVGKDSAEKREFIEAFNKKISGSFHGTTNFSPQNFWEYFKGMLLKDYWSKVTKRKTLWNLDTSVKDWRKTLSRGKLIPKPDVVIYIYDKSENITADQGDKYFLLSQNESENEEIMKECIYHVLSVQATRTKRHLMDKVSPTAKTKI